MREDADVPLAELTTTRVGGPARRVVTVETPEELSAAVAAADGRGEPLLVLGGGSNILASDAGFDGTVVRVLGGAVAWSPSSVVADAGVVWDDLVAAAVARGLAGIECLSGVPGCVGAVPIQNVGAYGQEVAETITAVEVHDRRTGGRRRMTPQECGFRYRDSVFKGDDRFVVLRVNFTLDPADAGSARSRPVRYAELAARLGVRPGDRAPLADVRAAVLDLRRAKGMVLDADDHDTWSTGSFFTNPILTADALADLRERAARLPVGPDGAPPRPPEYPQDDGRTKTSAAWLIQHAGFAKGHGDGPARISTKHTLALTNRGTAKTADILALAREVRAGVRAAFGVELVNEPVLLGVDLAGDEARGG